jgi:hypothetical protein
VKILGALTPEELARAEKSLLHPAPGSRIEAAQNYGVDLTLLVEQLRLTPAMCRSRRSTRNSDTRLRLREYIYLKARARKPSLPRFG